MIKISYFSIIFIFLLSCSQENGEPEHDSEIIEKPVYKPEKDTGTYDQSVSQADCKNCEAAHEALQGIWINKAFAEKLSLNSSSNLKE
jgi:hypothetical protein